MNKIQKNRLVRILFIIVLFSGFGLNSAHNIKACSIEFSSESSSTDSRFNANYDFHSDDQMQSTTGKYLFVGLNIPTIIQKNCSIPLSSSFSVWQPPES